MKLTREELKGISAGASAVEYTAFPLLNKLINAIVDWIQKVKDYFGVQ